MTSASETRFDPTRGIRGIMIIGFCGLDEGPGFPAVVNRPETTARCYVRPLVDVKVAKTG